MKRRLISGWKHFVLTALVLIVTGALAYANGSTTPTLIETSWLANNLKNPELRIVHVGFVSQDDQKKYEGKHIPGAVYLQVGELMGAIGNGSTPPDKSKFKELMEKLGISNNTHVILYGAPAGNPFVPGAFWLMKYFGHDRVSILNGQFAKWEKENRPVENKAVSVSKATYTPKDGDLSLYADAAYVLKNLKNKGVVIIDTRSADEYHGKKPRNKRKGHIPGAINLNFYATNRNPDGTYKSSEDLESLYTSKGVTKDKEIITYCEGGVRAADTFLTLRYLLGYPNVKVYVGSWGEWGNRLDPDKYPLEK